MMCDPDLCLTEAVTKPESLFDTSGAKINLSCSQNLHFNGAGILCAAFKDLEGLRLTMEIRQVPLKAFSLGFGILNINDEINVKVQLAGCFFIHLTIIELSGLLVSTSFLS